MVARIATGRNIHGVLRYNEQKVQEGNAELVIASRFLHAPSELSWQQKVGRFERLQEKAPRVKTNVVHISLNFHPAEQLTDVQFMQIANSYMQRIGFGEQPYLAYRHYDAGHPHLHLVTTNITRDGQRINTHNIGREKSEPARKALELEYQLLPAQGNTMSPGLPLSLDQLEQVRYGQAETKRSIARVVHTVLRHYNITSLAELNVVLRQYNVLADQGPPQSHMHRRKGLVYHVMDQKGQKVGVPQKASALPGKPTLAHLEKQFSTNRRQREPLRQAVRQQVDRALQQVTPKRPLAFLQTLNQAGIEVLFRESAHGQVYGVTFLDHRNRAVINGRELGKAYGAKQLLECLSRNASEPMVRPAIPGSRENIAATQAFPEWATQGLLPNASRPGILIRELLEARQEAAYLPSALQQKRRKRKKRRQTLYKS